MPVNLEAPLEASLFDVPGVELGYGMAGIKYAGKKDLLVVALKQGASVAGVFTQNRFCAAPVTLCKKHLQSTSGIRALVINTGNANAGTGKQGDQNALKTAQAVASLMGFEVNQVLVFSTGVIMEPLPMPRLLKGIDQAVSSLGKATWFDAASAIMTTDTLPKAYSQKVNVGGSEITLTGMSKGAGMIRPNMATMLGFIALDATINQQVLNNWVKRLADASFNRITIDGDTSTNDSFVIMSTGENKIVNIQTGDEPEATRVFEALKDLSILLAQAIVRDGEGATKFITVSVNHATSEQEAAQVAYAIAHSPLVKTAFFASDPNLGRILAAIGNAGIHDLQVDRVDLYLNDVCVAKGGGRSADYLEAAAQQVMDGAEITITVELNRGEAGYVVWTTGLSHDYVSINADYRT